MVGEELGVAAAAGAGLAEGLVGGDGLLQGGHDGGVVGVAEDGGDECGAVAEPAAGDPAPGLGFGAAVRGAVGVGAHDFAGGGEGELAVAEERESVGEGGVDGAAVLGAEVAGAVGDDLGAVFVEVAAFEGGEGLGEVARRVRWPGW